MLEQLSEGIIDFIQNLEGVGDLVRIFLDAVIKVIEIFYKWMEWLENDTILAVIAIGVFILLVEMILNFIKKGGLAKGLLGHLGIALSIVVLAGAFTAGMDAIATAITNQSKETTTVTVTESINNNSETSAEEEESESSEILPEEEEEQNTHGTDFLSDEDKAVYSEQWDTLYKRWTTFLSYDDDTSIININRMIASSKYKWWLARMQSNYPLIYTIWEEYGIQVEDFEEAYQAYLQNVAEGYSNITGAFSYSSGGGMSTD